MASNIISLTFPSDVIQRCQGFAMDFGGSAIKIVYRGKRGGPLSYDKLYMTCFERSEMAEALSFILDQADIRRDANEEPEVSVTGLGTNQFGEMINRKLRVKLKVQTEFDSFISGLQFVLNNIPRKALVYELNEELISQTIKEESEKMTLVAEARKNTGLKSISDTKIVDRVKGLLDKQSLAESAVPLGKNEDIYPCLLIMIGSAVFSYKVMKDGSYSLADGSIRGGISAYGLATILTGCKTYKEFLELAEKGDDIGVNNYWHELHGGANQASSEGASQEDQGAHSKLEQTSNEEKQENCYSALKEHNFRWLIFFFGKGMNSHQGQFSREDLARALLLFFVNEFAHLAQMNAQMSGCKHVLFCGSFINSPLVRKLLTSELTRRMMTVSTWREENLPDFSFDFLVPGPYLGAIGALLKGTQQQEKAS